MFIQHVALGEQLCDYALLLCSLQVANRGLFCIGGCPVRRSRKNVPIPFDSQQSSAAANSPPAGTGSNTRTMVALWLALQAALQTG